MDNYNNLIGNQYGNIYGADLQNQLLHQQQQQQQQIGDGGMLMQSAGHDLKNLTYETRESIIAPNQSVSYDQQPHMLHHHQAPPSLSIPPENVPQQHVMMESLQQHQPVPSESVIQPNSTQEMQPMPPTLSTDEPIAAVPDVSDGHKLETNIPVTEEGVILSGEQAADGDEIKNGDESKEETEVAAPTTKPDAKKSEIDPQQCRVCMSKETLVDIFQFEDVFRINDLIMKICPTIRITERDFLPHLICSECVTKVKIAYQLKTTCENTEKEYRSNLKRSRNKTRAPTDYVLVNAPDFTESEEDEEVQDEEFKISESEEESEDDSDESFELDHKKKRSSRKSSSSRRKSQKSSKKSGSSKKFKPDVVFIEANNDSSEEDDSDDYALKKSVNNNSAKRKAPANRGAAGTPTSVKKSDAKQVPTCHICNKTFVKRSSLKSHVERHNEPATVDCDVCHRTFSSKGRMERHSCQAKSKSRRPTSSAPSRSAAEVPSGTGRDLFKTVAPVTSTYWSDDFSD